MWVHAVGTVRSVRLSYETDITCAITNEGNDYFEDYNVYSIAKTNDENVVQRIICQ